VEIVVHLHPDSAEDSDKTIEALYALTECEVSISPNACVIMDGKPQFLGVNEILRNSAENTKELLKRELEIHLSELMEDWHFSSLEKIFIENRIYRKIEECETWEAVLEAIDAGLKPFKKKLKREITQEDIIKLTEIKIKRISKFDAFKADEHIKALNEKMKEIKNNLENLTQYAIAYYKELLKKYGKGRERKTQISEEGFETIEAKKVVINNARLYVNREEGFAGYGMKKDELVADCSDIDDVLSITGEGKFSVSKIAEKNYVGKDVRHIALFNKNEENKIYNLIYRDGLKGSVMIKRFAITGVTRDKIYELTKGTEHSKILYLGISGINNAPTLQVILKPRPKLRNTVLTINLNDVMIKNRGAVGNLLTKFPVQKISNTGQVKPSAVQTEIAVDDKKEDERAFEQAVAKQNASRAKGAEKKERVQMKLELQ
jgi:topoisomerase-4 subunit A